MTYFARCFMTFLSLSLVCAGLSVVQVRDGRAAATAGARLSQAGANSVVIEVTLSQPAPANLIVQLRLPPGTTIVTAQPSPAKLDPQRGVVKWLLRDTRPGRLTLRVTTARPLDLAATRAFVRYRQPDTGSLVELEASR